MLEKLIVAAITAATASGVLAAGHGIYQYIVNAAAEYSGLIDTVLSGGVLPW